MSYHGCLVIKSCQFEPWDWQAAAAGHDDELRTKMMTLLLLIDDEYC